MFGINGPLGTMLGRMAGLKDAETDWMTPEKLVLQCKAGDLIEFFRGKYCHWAMCSEDPTYVYNIDAEDKNNTTARITLRKLVDVANTGDTPGHRVVRINNKTLSASKKLLMAKDAKEAIAAAKLVVNTYVKYGFLSTNCEYYCCKWKFGQGWTDQVEDVGNVLQPPRLFPSPSDMIGGMVNNLLSNNFRR